MHTSLSLRIKHMLNSLFIAAVLIGSLAPFEVLAQQYGGTGAGSQFGQRIIDNILSFFSVYTLKGVSMIALAVVVMGILIGKARGWDAFTTAIWIGVLAIIPLAINVIFVG
jgi:hypothetical protein